MILSLFVVGMVALIAYWWANQGLVSALLHFLCVVVAGAIAFSLWEWVTVSFFLNGKRFDEYAWGITLATLFIVALIALRYITDRLVPREGNAPGALNVIFGGLFGLGAGILSVGIALTAWGYLQSSGSIMGYEGFRRTQQFGGLPTQTQPNMPPTLVLKATEFAFARLSTGAFSPIAGKTNFATAMPALHELAGSAMRDSFGDGKGKISAPNNSMRVTKFYDLPTVGEGFYVARLEVEAPAFDRRSMFTLSSSQARLVGDDARDPGVSYPKEFAQRPDANAETLKTYEFSDVTYFASSPPGTQSAAFYLAFPKSPLRRQEPAFLQVKGLRLTLPPVEREATTSSLATLVDRESGGDRSVTAQALRELFEATSAPPALGASHIEANSTIAPAAGSINTIPGTLLANESRRLISGAGEFRIGGSASGNRDLQITGIFEPPGTRVVRLSATKNLSPVDLYNIDRIRALRRRAGEGATVEIVDRNFATYQPFGYVWRRAGGTVWIYLDRPTGGVWTLHDLPNIGDEDELYLLYRLPVETRVGGVIFRDPSQPIEKAAVAAVADWPVPPK